MELFVNNEKLDITLESEKTVGDVLASFEKIAAENSGTTVGIKINGEEIPASDFDDACLMGLEKVSKLELTVIFLESLKTAFKDISRFSKDISNEILNVPVLLQSSKDTEANTIIARLADLIDMICSGATYASLFPEFYSSIKIEAVEGGSHNLSEFFADLQPILHDFQDAMENKDSVLVGDLCEYEISPRLQNLSNALTI